MVLMNNKCKPKAGADPGIEKLKLNELGDRANIDGVKTKLVCACIFLKLNWKLPC